MRLVLINPALKAYDSSGNCSAIESLIVNHKHQIRPDDIILLPEHYTFDDHKESYLQFIQKLAVTAGCTVVGGSHHRFESGKRVNAGNIVDASGNVIAQYTKLRPYFDELKHIFPGDAFGEVTINGKNILILICADFWYSDLILSAKQLPDVILIPSLSVSRKPTPEYSRSLWHHLAITRAYEFGAYIGISDWSEHSSLPKLRTCGVGGFADPTSVQPEKFFQPIDESGISMFNLDFEALEKFREDRRMRGFYWK